MQLFIILAFVGIAVKTKEKAFVILAIVMIAVELVDIWQSGLRVPFLLRQ